MAHYVFEEQSRAIGPQEPVGYLGYLQLRVDRSGDAVEVAFAFQKGDEFTQVTIRHLS